jgi:hypothetical protein
MSHLEGIEAKKKAPKTKKKLSSNHGQQTHYNHNQQQSHPQLQINVINLLAEGVDKDVQEQDDGGRGAEEDFEVAHHGLWG